MLFKSDARADSKLGIHFVWPNVFFLKNTLQIVII